MGKFEKLVVVVVLLLSAVVLAVSLRGSGEASAKNNPLEAAGALPESAPDAGTSAALNSPQTSAVDPAGASKDAKPGYLLDAGLSGQPTSAPGAAKPAGAPAGPARILRASHGLVPSALDDFMVYTAVQGDDWSGLAERFYGNASYVANLREANEGMETLSPGAPILVPVYDLQAGSAAPASSTAPAGGPTLALDATPPATSGAPAWRGPTTYEVKDGDNLSKVSKAVYGTAVYWSEIYDANRDQLRTPDWLKVGMKLKIPPPPASASKAGATVAASTKTSAKPKAAPVEEQPKTAEKKRRVQ